MLLVFFDAFAKSVKLIPLKRATTATVIRQFASVFLVSLVLVKQHQLSRGVDGFAAKLAPKCDGPFRVLKFISPNTVRIQRPGERKRKVANIAELREFRDDETGKDEEVT